MTGSSFGLRRLNAVVMHQHSATGFVNIPRTSVCKRRCAVEVLWLIPGPVLNVFPRVPQVNEPVCDPGPVCQSLEARFIPNVSLLLFDFLQLEAL